MKKTLEVNLVVGNAIRDGLQRRKMTQGELAGIVGSTQRSISSYVNGNAQPPLDILVNICRILEINLNQILRVPEYDSPYRILKDRKEIDCLNIMAKVPKARIDEYLEVCSHISDLLK